MPRLWPGVAYRHSGGIGNSGHHRNAARSRGYRSRQRGRESERTSRQRAAAVGAEREGGGSKTHDEQRKEIYPFVLAWVQRVGSKKALETQCNHSPTRSANNPWLVAAVRTSLPASSSRRSDETTDFRSIVSTQPSGDGAGSKNKSEWCTQEVLDYGEIFHSGDGDAMSSVMGISDPATKNEDPNIPNADDGGLLNRKMMVYDGKLSANDRDSSDVSSHQDDDTEEKCFICNEGGRKRHTSL